MKKFVKFVCSVAAGAAAGFGAYCVYKNVIAKKNNEELDDFDDCFDEDETDENREYVSINITEEPASEEVEEAVEVEEETTEETKVKEEVEETK